MQAAKELPVTTQVTCPVGISNNLQPHSTSEGHQLEKQSPAVQLKRAKRATAGDRQDISARWTASQLCRVCSANGRREAGMPRRPRVGSLFPKLEVIPMHKREPSGDRIGRANPEDCNRSTPSSQETRA